MKGLVRKGPTPYQQWCKLSTAQQYALPLLDFAVPQHQTILSRMGIASSTLRSLQGKGLAAFCPLNHRGMVYATSMPFYTQTQLGQELCRAARRAHNANMRDGKA